MGTNLKRFAFDMRRHICRQLIGMSRNPRPDSLPFVSGDTFRAVAQHVHDETGTFDPTMVKDGDSVFVNSDLVEGYFADIHPKIPARYVLITHNSDHGVEERHVKHLDERILAWFGQNVAVKHARIIPIPIGMENRHWCNNGNVRDFLRWRSAREYEPRKNAIFYGFSTGTNPAQRQPALDVLSRCPLAEKSNGWLSPPSYQSVLRRFKFVVSPPGNGSDCHRTWEALLLRTVPIVKRNPCHDYFCGLGLPLLSVDNWDQIEAWDEHFLQDTYERLKSGFDNPHVYFEPWKRMVLAWDSRKLRKG